MLLRIQICSSCTSVLLHLTNLCVELVLYSNLNGTFIIYGFRGYKYSVQRHKMDFFLTYNLQNLMSIAIPSIFNYSRTSRKRSSRIKEKTVAYGGQTLHRQ